MLFSHFEKYRKIDAKMAPKMIQKSTKIDPRSAKGRFIHRFYGFWAVSKIRSFLMSSWGVKKSTKIEPWGAKGSKRCLRLFAGPTTAAAGGPCQRLARAFFGIKIFETGTTSCPNTPWAKGPANVTSPPGDFGPQTLNPLGPCPRPSPLRHIATHLMG